MGSADFWPSSSQAQWLDEPHAAFRDWLAQLQVTEAGLHFRQSSFATYAAMFSAWCQFLTTRRMSVLEAGPKDVEDFLAQKVLDKGMIPVSRRRYLQLLDRVYQHLVKQGLVCAPSPCAAALAREGKLELNELPGLDAAQVAQLIEVLQSLPGWKGARDRALAALFLGAGLRVNEAQFLRLSHLRAAHEIDVQPAGVHRAHRSLMVPDGPWRDWMAQWLEVRQARRVMGEYVCPSKRSGEAYSPSGIYCAVRAWFRATGLPCDKDNKTGANVLRNTFAREALQCGRYSLEEVQEFLGHEQLRATSRHVAEGTLGQA